jgi:hypothetical protein
VGELEKEKKMYLRKFFLIIFHLEIIQGELGYEKKKYSKVQIKGVFIHESLRR